MPPRRGLGRTRASLRRLSARSRSSPCGGDWAGTIWYLNSRSSRIETGMMFSEKNSVK